MQQSCHKTIESNLLLAWNFAQSIESNKFVIIHIRSDSYVLKHLKLEYLPLSICTSLSSLYIMLLKLEYTPMLSDLHEVPAYLPSLICTSTILLKIG